ncbi:hypothetical protein PHMEG_0007137 [Phytophthora megakarya]|uniref:Uncharacterized protein n=1 Tax=Phytophthora megakarya TaxID=4795 RepID=A0A225WM50_9STRA|nr:hypothetical protein PHMEG_0007137 [Phytophthora megakarya]
MHASTGRTPFFVNSMRHPRLPSTLGAVASSLIGEGATVALKQTQNRGTDTDLSAAMTHARARDRTRQGDVSVPGTDTVENHEQATPALTEDNVSVQSTDTARAHAQARPERHAVVRFVQDAFTASADRQKLNADNVGRSNTNEFKIGSLVLLSTQNLPHLQYHDSDQA